MRFPESWLREHVDPAADLDTLAERLTLVGHEIDAIASHGAGLDGIVVARVVSVGPHPDADSLSVCRAFDGETELDVVCGAPNVEAGMHAALARPGVRLPDGTKMRRRKIRGVVSDGMLCSAAELGLGEEADGILKLPADALPGVALGAYLGLPDRVIEVDLTPNRGDCFSIRGMAREVAAITGAALKPLAESSVGAGAGAGYPLEIADPLACPRFAGRVVRNIDTRASSPAWMTERLRRCGIRPIHPVVDITNYVMLESGQPLHAYDLDRLQGPVKPRFAIAGETVTLLDGRTVTVDADTVVISDDSGAIGLAGIMGGLGSAVTGDTRNVFFEAAFWPPPIVAGRARGYGLHTDASLRFERGVDPTGQARAVDRATALLLDIAGGEPGPLQDEVCTGQLPVNQWVELRSTRLARVLGAALSREEVGEILRRLELEVRDNESGWEVRAPSFRFDLRIEDDLIEEVARIYGYDRIPETTETAPLPLGPVTETRLDPEQLATTLVARGYSEVVTYSFIAAEQNRQLTGSESALILSNPISSDMSVMRGSLWPGVLHAAANNLARQQDRLRLFEIGTVFHGTCDAPGEVLCIAGLALGPVVEEQWDGAARDVDFFDIKCDLEALLDMTGPVARARFEAAEHPALHPGQSARVRRDGNTVGHIGKLHPAVADSLQVSRDVFLFELNITQAFAAKVPRATTLSRFPAVRRDIAVVVDQAVPTDALVDVVLAAAPDIIRRVVIFDVYRGKGIEAGRKSVALGLILQETSRTLTDLDADKATLAAVRGLQQEFAAVLRD